MIKKSYKSDGRIEGAGIALLCFKEIMAILIVEGIARREDWQGQERQKLIELLKPYVPGGVRLTKKAVKKMIKGEHQEITISSREDAQRLLPVLNALGLNVNIALEPESLN